MRRGFKRGPRPQRAWRWQLVPVVAIGVLALVVIGKVASDLRSHPAATRADVIKTKHGSPMAAAASTRPAGQVIVSAPNGQLHSSCRSVVHIGDSTSEGLVSSNYLPNAAQRIPARYAAVGAVSQHMEISGGTSIIETLPGTSNAYKVASGLVAKGYKGCWVIALGTNDTADVYVGSNVGRADRIKKMMSVIGSDPVMWVNVKSLLSSGPYSEQDMRLWDDALMQELPHYPNMRVYNWAAVVQNGWFINDGIHYTSAGYAQRAKMIANALAQAFPATAG